MAYRCEAHSWQSLFKLPGAETTAEGFADASTAIVAKKASRFGNAPERLVHDQPVAVRVDQYPMISEPRPQEEIRDDDGGNRVVDAGENDNHVLLFALEFKVEGQVHRPDPGDELLIPAGGLHSARNIGTTTAHWLYGYGQR